MRTETTAYLKYYERRKGAVALSFFLSLFQAISLLPVAVLIQRIFDGALPSQDAGGLVRGLMIVLGLFAINACAALWNRQVTLATIKQVIYEMRTQLVARSMRWSRQRYAGSDLDLMHSRIVNDTERIDCMTSAFLTQFLPGILIAIGLSGVLAYLNPRLFLVVIAALPVLYGAGKIMGISVKKKIRKFHSDFAGFSKGSLFALKFNELIKLSTAEEQEMQRQYQYARDLQFSSHGMAWLSTAYGTLQNNILLIVGILVLLVGGFEVISGAMSVGALLSFYIALNLLNANARNAFAAVPVMIEGRESLAVVMPLLTEELPASPTGAFSGFQRDIVFEQVHFGHENSDFSLKDVNFAVPKNSVFGIVGASGAGKSTLLNLLLGFYTPHQGRVLIDGRSVHEIDPVSYRQRVGVLTQDPLMFPGTIRENLSYGLSDVSDEQLQAACRVADIDEYVQSLEKGYETEIGERGAKLSGGQKQRLALVRALLRRPEILILDEPDNNLSEEMFVRILGNIKELQVTVFVISHNQNLRPHFNGIYEL